MPRPHGMRAEDYAAQQRSQTHKRTSRGDESRQWRGEVEIGGETIAVPIAARTKAEAEVKLGDEAQRILLKKLYPTGSVEVEVACRCDFMPHPHLFERGSFLKLVHDGPPDARYERIRAENWRAHGKSLTERRETFATNDGGGLRARASARAGSYGESAPCTESAGIGGNTMQEGPSVEAQLTTE